LALKAKRSWFFYRTTMIVFIPFRQKPIWVIFFNKNMIVK